MALRLYNRLTDRIEPFTPAGPRVALYVCGVTPYDVTHLGHAFTYVAFDVLVRWLEHRGHPVTYVQNVTDVDDDILARARQTGLRWDVLAHREFERFRADLEALNVRRPDHWPWASQAVPQIVALCEQLTAAGRTYRRDHNLYFRVRSVPDYGRLSRLDRATMIALARERGGYPDDPRKEDPLDFVLWQASLPDEPAWASPWGLGRPGWHIECVAMILAHLGYQADLVGGGSDLIFPHHENQLTLGEALTGRRPFARFWVHTGMVCLGGTKMAKSLGNLVLAHSVIAQIGGNATRWLLLSHHYRTDWEYNAADLASARDRWERVRAAITAPPGQPNAPAVPYTDLETVVAAALDDDLNTPRALAALEAWAGRLLAADPAATYRAPAQAALQATVATLGFRPDLP